MMGTWMEIWVRDEIRNAEKKAGVEQDDQSRESEGEICVSSLFPYFRGL